MPISLIEAVKTGNLTEVLTLLKLGGEVNAKDKEENTALHIASHGGHTEIVLVLIGKGADIDAKNKWGETALHWASRRGHTATALELIKNKAKVNATDNNSCTPLHQAAIYGRTETASMLIENEAEIDTKNRSGITALLWASYSGHTETILLFMEKGADVKIMDIYKQSPLECYLKKIRTIFSEDTIPEGDLLKAMQNVVNQFVAKGADVDYALDRLGLMHHKEKILNGNLFAGMDAITRFMNDKQNTHDPLVTKTIKASMQVLRARYGSSLNRQTIEASILGKAKELCESNDFVKKLSLQLAKQKNLTLQEQKLIGLLKKDNQKLRLKALISIVKQFLHHLDIANQSKIHQSAHLLWVALHDSQHRYRTINTVEKDIQEAEIAFVREILKAGNCTEGGLFHPMVALCRFLGIPGIYVHELLTERMAVSRGILLDLLDSTTAFNWSLREVILSDDSAYKTFIDTLRHNHELYKTHGQTQVRYFGEKEEILSEDELREFEQRLRWTREKYRAFIQEKGVGSLRSPNEEQVEQLEGWAKTLNSATPRLAWSLMSDYYTQQIQMVERREIAREALEAQMRADYAVLATRCPIQNTPDEDGVNYLETFFNLKQSQLGKALLKSTPPMAFQPPPASPQEKKHSLEVKEKTIKRRKIYP